MIRDLILCAVKNIRRKKLRSFLTMLGIIIGVASVTTIMAIGTGGKEAINGELDKFGLNGLSVRGTINENGKKGLLSSKEYLSIKRYISEAKDIMPVIYYNGNIIGKTGSRECIVWGIGDNAAQTISLNPEYGNLFNKRDIEAEKLYCIIDSKLAQYFFKRENVVGKEIDINVKGMVRTFVIKGVVNSKDSMLSNIVGDLVPSFIYIPYTTAQKIYNIKSFDQIIINVKESSDIDKVGLRVSNLLSITNQIENGYTAENMVKQKKKLENIVDIITVIISAVAAISLFVGGIGIMTIMLVAVSERKREIGIKKAVGASCSMIVWEFVVEAVTITFSGGIVGMVLSLILVKLINYFLNFQAKIDFSIILMSLIFSVVIGIIFSVYPAKKAAKLNPIDALRYE